MEREAAIKELVRRTLEAVDGAFDLEPATEWCVILNAAAGKPVAKVVEATAEWCKGRYAVDAI